MSESRRGWLAGWSSSGPSRNSAGFPEYNYNYFRDYDPSIGRYVESDPIGLRGGPNTYVYTASNPLALTDPSGLLFGGAVNAGEAYGDSAAQYWADRANQTGNPLYHIPGALASLWTNCTSDETALTLGSGLFARIIGPFGSRGMRGPLGQMRRLIRFDRPHHGKGWQFDGKIPNWIRGKWGKFFGMGAAGEGADDGDQRRPAETNTCGCS